MRTALEVIRRLEWDPACCAAAVVVGYRDRIFGEIVERPLDAFSNWGAIELADENELAIPQHRVVYFKSGDAIVWDKRRIYDVDGMSCRLDGVYIARYRQGRPVGDRGAAARVAAQSRLIDPARSDDRTPPSPDDGAARLPVRPAPDDWGRVRRGAPSPWAPGSGGKAVSEDLVKLVPYAWALSFFSPWRLLCYQHRTIAKNLRKIKPVSQS